MLHFLIPKISKLIRDCICICIVLMFTEQTVWHQWDNTMQADEHACQVHEHVRMKFNVVRHSQTSALLHSSSRPDVVEAHCYIVNIGRTDGEQIRSRINNNWCRMFWPHRPLSTLYKTVLYAVDKGLCGRNVLHQLLSILLCICLRSVCPSASPVIAHHYSVHRVLEVVSNTTCDHLN